MHGSWWSRRDVAGEKEKREEEEGEKAAVVQCVEQTREGRGKRETVVLQPSANLRLCLCSMTGKSAGQGRGLGLGLAGKGRFGGDHDGSRD